MTAYHKIVFITLFITVISNRAFCQTADITLSQPLTGNQTIEATNSITFAGGFSYDAASSYELIARIIPAPNYSFTEPQENGTLQVNTSYPVGSINGSISVGPTGAANYVVPIDIPLGRNGMKPNLSLVYNSQGGEGLLGLGWALSGLSAVTRVPTDFYHEGFIDAVDFDSNDKFALDGQRLIAIGGDQYRTENESFSKITLYGSSTNPTSFKVETKDGLELYYGNTSDSRVEAQGTSNVYAWNLNQVRDKNGNFYNITYTETTSTGEVYPANINYSCYGTSAGDYTIEFGYENRSVPLKTYLYGSQVLINKLLNLITIKYGTTTVGKLQLVYTNSKLGEVIKFGKNNTRLNSTFVNWGSADVGLGESSKTAIAPLTGRLQGDFNGDGKTDLVVLNLQPTNPPTYTCNLYLADNTGSLIYTSSTLMPVNFQPNQMYPGDYNGDGLQDLLVFRLISGTYYLSFFISNGSSFTEIDYSTPFSSSSSTYYTGDFNGNGKMDLMIKTTGTYNCLIYEFNFPGGGGVTPTLIGQSNITWGTGSSFTMIKEVPFDMNGDGKTELMALDNTGSRFYGLQDGTTAMYQISSSSTINNANVNLFGDFNGDGLTDIFSFDPNNNWWLNISKGNGFDQVPITTFSGFNPYVYYNNFYAYDMNGDGKSDIVVVGKGTNINNPVKIYVGYSDGQNFSLQTYTPISNVQVSPIDPITFYDYYDRFGDYNGDGVTDFYYEDGTIAKLINTYRGRSQYFVSAIKNGFGYSNHLNYAPLTDNTIYSKGAVTTYPVNSIQAPLYVITSVLADNPDFTHSTTNYTYYGAHSHRLGKGFLGFEKLTSVNTTSNLKSIDEYEYNPTFFNVSLKKKKLYSVEQSEILISETDFTNNVNDFGSQRIFPYIDYSTETNSITGNIITKDYTYDSNGNLTSYREDFDDGSYNLNTSSNFSSSGTWLPSKPQTVIITKKHYQDSQNFSITNSFTYYPTGQINTKTVGPLTTTYTYDSFGNLTYETLSDGSTSRTNHFTYDSQNMFIWKSYNAMDHVTERTYDYVTGNVLSEKTPDNVVTNFTYDDFGTLTNKSTTALGQSQSVAIGWTTGTRPLGSVYSKQITTSGAPTTKEYYDYLGRILRTETAGFDGNLVYLCTLFNNKGQISEISLPYKQGETALKTVFSYDRYGRKITEASTAGTITTSYTGKEIHVTKSGGQTFSKTSDSQGNIVNATDNAGSTDYTFKSIGKPGTITSAGSSWSMVYDTYGRQTSLTDPNAGTITYGYNNYGEITSQTDARNLTRSLTYDNLGRVHTQVSPEGTKTFIYDPSGNPGLLSSVTFPGGSETYNYDANSRLTSKVENNDGTNYTTAYGYDGYSRIETITYPSNFAIKNVYNTFGYQSEVRRNDNNSLIWQGQDVNAFGHFTRYTYGNNITTTKAYNCLGMLSNISAGSVQNMDYSFDMEKGNLLSRHDNLCSLTETFSYDNIDRLTGVSGPAPLTMTYSSNGNILSKTSVGDYSYGGSKPHAVTSVTNPDGLISNTTQTITYTSFDKVNSIVQGSLTYNLTYGYKDQRTISRLYDNGVLQKTTYYVGGYEKEVKPGNNIRQIHYITGGDGLAAIFVKNNGMDTLYYVHTDHLGSINVITNQSGAVVKNYSFDAWGRRRNPLDWTYNNIPSTFLFSRGFTGHEHLDQFNLVNMNGRVYDPLLGRFLSPDNFIQSPDFTQSFNRYGYCLNNPLRYTDLTGYTWLSHFGNWIGGSIVAKVVITAVINVVGIGALILSGGTIGGFGYYNGKSDWMINAGVMGGGFAKGGINIGGNKNGFYMYGQTVVSFNSPDKPSSSYTSDSGTAISEADLNNIGTSTDYVVGEGGKYLGESVPNYGGINGLTINTFYGYSASGIGGVVISLTYTSTTEAQGGDWVQVVSTDFPDFGKTSPYFDSKDGSIYYPYKTIEGNSISFYDNPKRPLYDAFGRSKNGDWIAFLSLYKGSKPIFGITYGYNMHFGVIMPYYIQVIYP